MGSLVLTGVNFVISLVLAGWMYLSINHLCFYSFLMGSESTVCLRWSDITSIERKSNMMGNNRITVCSFANPFPTVRAIYDDADIQGVHEAEQI